VRLRHQPLTFFGTAGFAFVRRLIRLGFVRR
jgi:hypothetical protein